MEPSSDQAFRRAMGAFATGVTVISAARPNGAFSGITVNSFTSVSLKPALILWCLGDQSERYDHFAEANAWGVTILAADEREIAKRFANSDHETLAATEVEMLANAPVLKGAGVAQLACVTHDKRIAGDHLIIIGEVREFRIQAGDALTFFGGRYGRAEAEGL
ncbi:NADH-FMN oxidoreductase [alpha proteobacterium U9-1i]|nr:NADH-FMN oxidoreductase [alpha proteobacterium U9-1i]